jgi:hypothetical protein
MSEDVSLQPSEDANISEASPIESSEGTSSSEVVPAKTAESTSTNEAVPAKSPEGTSMIEVASEETSTNEVIPAKIAEGTNITSGAPIEAPKETSTSEIVPATTAAKPAKRGNRGLDIFKRILVGIVMVLTLLGLIVNISELVAVWAAYGPARNSVITVSNTLIQGLQVADKGLARANGYVQNARQTVTDVNNTASLLGDHIKANSPLVTALAQRVDTRLAPVLAKAQTTASTIHDAALKVNGALEALNRFPGVSVPTLNDQLTGISNRAQEAQSSVQDLRVTLANIKAGAVTKAETTIKQVTARIDAPLARIQSLVSTYQTKVANAQVRVTSTSNSILTWLLITAISLTILSLVVTAALLLLFLLCLQFIIHGRFPSLRVGYN